MKYVHTATIIQNHVFSTRILRQQLKLQQTAYNFHENFQRTMP
jgi:hypothetical protein